MSGYAPRALADSVRPRRLVGTSGRPLNFTVSRLLKNPTDRAEFGERTERS